MGLPSARCCVLLCLSRALIFTTPGLFSAAALAVVLSGQVCQAQKDTGTIAGTVHDSSGAVIPNVNITARDVNHGTVVNGTTNSSGEYVIQPLKVGEYVMTAAKTGFDKVASTPITLSVQQRLVFDITMKVGSIGESVTVTDSTAQLQTETSDLGQVLDARQITNLPLNGRNFAQLALLSPGTTPAAPGSRDQSSYGFSANGARSLQNNFLLDGIDNNSNLPDLLNGSSYVIEPPVESLQEFKVQTSSYTAEFGRGNGAVINAVTKSGTNELHGALYEFFRNDALDAKNHFDTTKQPYKQNQFGGTVGGPVVLPHIYNGRDKTFFFTDYEGFRSIDAQPIPAIVPTLAQRGGDFSANLDYTQPTLDPVSGAPVLDCNGIATYQGEIFNSRLAQVTAAGGNTTGYCGTPFGYSGGQPVNVIPEMGIDPLARRLADLYPAPNANNPGYNFVSSPKRVINRNNFDLRLDHQFSAQDSAFARYSFETVPSNIPAVFGPIADGGDFFSGIANTHYHSLAIGDTHIFTPHLVNEFRFGYNRIYSQRVQPGYNSNIAQQIGFPGIPVAPSNGGLPQLTFSDVSTIGSSLFLPTRELQNTYIFAENLNWVIANHSLRFGAEIDRNEFAIYQPAEPRGTMDFGTQFTDNPGTTTIGTGGSGFASFLLGIPDTASISNAINIDYFRPSWAFYAQDDWKLSQRLTLNLGLRYELYQTVKERNNHEATYDLQTQTLILPKGQPAVLTPQLAALIPVNATGSDGLIHPDLNNFAPRLGAAYSLTHRAVLRAGYGFFYGGSESGPYSNPSPGYNPPYYRTNSYSPNCSLAYANPADPNNCTIPGLNVLANGFPADALSDPNTPLLYSLDPHLVTPYVQQYQLSAEYQLPSSLLFTAAYAGSHGLKLYTFLNGNEATPTADPTAPVAPRRPIPSIDAPIPWFRSSGRSNYNALELSLERTASSGLSLLASYTYAHSLDNASAANLGSQNGGDFRDFRHPELEYGNSDTDLRHRFTFSSLYPLPIGRGERFLSNTSRLVDTVAGQWQLGAIATLSTGNWYTATDAFNFSNVPDGGGNVGSSQRPDYAGNPNSKPCVPGTYFNTCAFADPPLGSFGTVNRNTIRGPGTEDLDFSLFKRLDITERFHLEFRSEFFNILNHYNPLFAPAAASATVGATVRDTPGFGFVTAAQPPRQIQFSLKLSY